MKTFDPGRYYKHTTTGQMVHILSLSSTGFTAQQTGGKGTVFITIPFADFDKYEEVDKKEWVKAFEKENAG